MSGITSVGGIVIPVAVIRVGDKAALLKLEAQFVQVQKAVNRASASMMQLGATATKSAGGVKGFLKGMTNVRWALVNVALVAMTAKLAFKAIGQPLIDLETEMAVVQKRTKMTGDDLKNLRGELINLSRTLPESASELAKIAGIAGQLGIRGATNITEFTRVTAMMGAATVLTTEEAGLALAKLSAAYDEPIVKAENMASVVNELSNNTAANSSEISRAMLKMATSAHQLGVTLDVSAAIGATLVDMGMKAERAGTRMKTVFTRMATETEKIAALYKGEFASDVSKAINDDANEAFLRLIGTIANTSDKTEKLRIATDIFGRVGGSAVLGLASNYLDLVKNIVMASDEFENAMSLQAEFDIQMSTTANQWKIYWGNIGSGWANFATSMNIDVTGALKTINDLNTLSREFNNMAKGRQEVFGEEDASSLGSMRFMPETGDRWNSGEALMLKEAANVKKVGDSYKEYRENVLDTLGVDTATELQEIELKIYYDYADGTPKEQQEAFKGVRDARIQYAKDVERATTRQMSESEINIAIQKVKELNIALGDAEGKQGRADAMVNLTNELMKYGDASQSVQERIDNEGQDLATLEKQYGTLDESIINTIQGYDEFKVALEEQARLFALDKASTAEFRVEVENLKTEYSDSISYQERYNANMEITKNITDDATDSTEKFASISKKAGVAFKYVNNILKSQIEIKKELLSEYGDARFTGETESLQHLHDMSLAIDKERLAQLKLTDSVKGTNDELASQQDSYTAWVETVQQFIKSTVASGTELGKNVSSSVTQYQALLLSSSRFSDGSADDNSTLDDMNREYDIAQLEHDIDYDEKHYKVNEYRDAVARLGQVEFETAEATIAAMKLVQAELDAQILQQIDLETTWEDAKTAEELYAAGFLSDADLINLSLDAQISKVKSLISEYRDYIYLKDAELLDPNGMSYGLGIEPNDERVLSPYEQIANEILNKDVNPYQSQNPVLYTELVNNGMSYAPTSPIQNGDSSSSSSSDINIGTINIDGNNSTDDADAIELLYSRLEEQLKVK